MYLHIIARLIECVCVCVCVCVCMYVCVCCVGRWAVVGMDVCVRVCFGASAVLCIRYCVSCTSW